MIAAAASWMVQRIGGPVLVYVAGGLLVALGAALVACAIIGARLDAAAARADAAESRAQQLAQQLDAARAAGAGWERVSMDLQRRLAEAVEAQRVQQERDAQAVARARAAAADADRTLRAWLGRYAQATRAAECAAIERLRVCEVGE